MSRGPLSRRIKALEAKHVPLAVAEEPVPSCDQPDTWYRDLFAFIMDTGEQGQTILDSLGISREDAERFVAELEEKAHA